MKRIVSRFVGTTLLRSQDHLYHSSRKIIEGDTAGSPLQFLGKNGCWGMHPHQVLIENKISQLGGHNFVMQRFYAAQSEAQPEIDEESIPESELRRKVGWLIKILAAVTITYVSFNVFPIMGDSLIWQSVALVRLDDPFMKRSGASRISMIATNDRRRKNFVEVGGVTELVKMLESAPDDKTRHEAVKALASLCECEMAVQALNATGAESLLKSLAEGSSDSKIENHSQVLLTKLQQWKGGPQLATKVNGRQP